jgi:hypothetical protein
VVKETFLKSANRKSANSWAHYAIANPQMANPQIVIINPQIPNPQTSTNAQRDFAEFISDRLLFPPVPIIYSWYIHTSTTYFLGQLEGATMY